MSQRDVQWGTLLESNITPHPALAELLNPQQRAQAVTSLTARDSQRAEAWRYTRLKGFNDRSLYNVSALAQATPSYTDVSGLSVYRISDLATRSAHLTGLTAEAWSWVSQQLTSQEPLQLLHTLHASDGWVVVVEDDVQGGDLELRHIISSGDQTQAGKVHLNAPQLWVYLGDRAQLKVTEHFGDDGESCSTLALSLSGFSLAQKSQLTYVRAQQSSRDLKNTDHVHLSRVSAQIAADASFKMTSLNLGSDLCRLELDVSLEESGAETDLLGLYLGSGSASIDQHLTLRHLAPQCVSSQRFKGAFGDHSKGIFTGRVIVAPGAHTTTADQYNPNLILSERAKAITRPQLEIYNDQVECSHGATVGQLDEEALFYLKTRGLSEAEALRALTAAFVGEVRAELEDSALINAVDLGLLTTLGLEPHERSVGEEWIDWEQLISGELP